ncbi:MAG: hypothetical protein V4596_08955 [Bdellovibrionota bacterium]
MTKLVALILSLSFAVPAIADKMDLDSHTSLISKLTQIVGFTEETANKQNMLIRLADLHSERARMYAMENEGKGEATYSKEIQSDRKIALGLYEKSFAKAGKKTQGLILLQRAHLHQLLGESKKSKSLFEQIIKNRKHYDAEVVAEAFIEAGDHEYNAGNFKKSLSHFQSALAIPKAQRRGYAKYRIAWGEFHAGNTNKAIQLMIALLRDPNTFKRPDGSQDSSFQEESSRDLATFLARKDINAQDIETLIELTPANIKEGNLTYLANELDRAGKKKSSLQVWAIIGNNKQKGDEKIEGQIKIARIQYDLNKKPETVKEIQIAAKMLVEDCESETNCKALEQLLRKLITDWGQAEERTPSEHLINAYKVYTSSFPDIEINYWAGIAAQKRKQYADAFKFYKNSAELSHEYKNNKDLKTQDKSITKIFEGSLLGSIEVAELAKIIELRDAAYVQYLNLNPNGEKALEVEYQIAQVLLEKGDHANAAKKFKDIALSDKKGPQSIKDKAADLSLDTLVILKEDEKLEEWAYEYAQKLPKRKLEFLAIARKSTLNQAAKAINSSKSESELEKHYLKLSKTDLSKATNTEKISYYKHRTLIAYKVKNLDALIASSNLTLKEKSASPSEKNEALTQLAWAFEMKMDFKNALATLKRISPDKKNIDEHVLKLGMLSELAEQNPTRYYEEFLDISNNKAQRQDVAYSLVRLAKNKNKAFNKYDGILAGNIKLYMQAGMLAFEEKKSDSLKREMLSKRGSSNTFEGQLLERIDALKEMQKEVNNLSQHRLRSSGPKNLRSSIAERLNLISRLERHADRAIRLKDFTLQLVALSNLSFENRRLASDILRLPMPKGLKAQQRTQYKKLIEDQVAPYNQKSKDLLSKTDELWNNKEDSSILDIMDVSTQSNSPGYKLAQEELKAVNQVAKRLNYSALTLTKKWQQRQKLSQELASVRTQVSKNPFDSGYLEKMKDIETRLNRGPMVAYLDARLAELKTGGR